MKALTIKSPWAELIILGVKDIENRTWDRGYRGRLAIHQGKGRERSAKQMAIAAGVNPDDWELYVGMVDEISAPGHVLGTVDIVGVVTRSSSVWALPNNLHWVLSDPKRFSQPVEAKGVLGLWNWTPPKL